MSCPYIMHMLYVNLTIAIPSTRGWIFLPTSAVHGGQVICGCHSERDSGGDIPRTEGHLPACEYYY